MHEFTNKSKPRRVFRFKEGALQSPVLISRENASIPPGFCREDRRAKAVEEGAEAYMDSMMKAVGSRKTEVDDEVSFTSFNLALNFSVNGQNDQVTELYDDHSFMSV